MLAYLSINAKTKKEAIDKQDEMRALLSKKYNYLLLQMITDSTYMLEVYPHYGTVVGNHFRRELYWCCSYRHYKL